MKYNFVIFASTFETYCYTYREMLGREDVQVYWDKSDLLDLLTPFEKKLALWHNNTGLNKFVRLPGKKFWYFWAAKKIRFETQRPICFVWHHHFKTEIENGMSDYIRKHYPDSRHVYFFTDPWKLNQKRMDFLKKRMDFVAVFDSKIAEKYDIVYLPNVYPARETGEKLPVEYDICFVGQDKGREKELFEFSRLCKAHGVKTAFYILGKEKGEKLDGIHYLKEKIAYQKVVELVRRSRCVLELKVEPDCSCSLRVQEAVVYNKKLITNNENVYRMPCCRDTRWIQYYKELEDIDWEFIKRDEDVDFQYHQEYSAQNWLERIERYLEKEGEDS